jgi:hypothetical protein
VIEVVIFMVVQYIDGICDSSGGTDIVHSYVMMTNRLCKSNVMGVCEECCTLLTVPPMMFPFDVN